MLWLLVGHYMYVETSKQSKGNKARLFSNLHYPTDGQCLMFYYHMYGTAVGVLNVYIREGGQLGNAVWTQKGNQGDRWYRGMVTIATSTTFNVSFFLNFIIDCPLIISDYIKMSIITLSQSFFKCH